MGLISHVVSRHLYVLMSCVSQGQMQYQIQYYVVYTVTRVHISNICVINNASLEKVIGLIGESKTSNTNNYLGKCTMPALTMFQVFTLFPNSMIVYKHSYQHYCVKTIIFISVYSQSSRTSVVKYTTSNMLIVSVRVVVVYFRCVLTALCKPTKCIHIASLLKSRFLSCLMRSS